MLNQIIGQHGNSVGRTFKKFGIHAPVNSKNLMAALVVHKGPFIGALAQDAEQTASFDGEKKTVGQKIKNTLLDVLTALGAGAAVAGAVRAGSTPPTQYPQYPVPEPVKKKPNMLAILGIGAAVATVIALIVIFSKNK